jgi:hypothetical protein
MACALEQVEHFLTVLKDTGKQGRVAMERLVGEFRSEEGLRHQQHEYEREYGRDSSWDDATLGLA